ncbi:hypothetical protein RRG08_016828 [Elysia crispata]|uniref:Uncharacterized protein n=1 Tax=Elysia crispata TaxID=231223 RepID=A0AAE0ZA21_9GAST|nr:hypothetical protein RRG08_016828 [Elysia crispata]
MDQLAFKRSVAQTYLKLLKVQEHLSPVVRTQQAKRQNVVPERRCRLCGKKDNMLCGACNVPLHKKCAEEFHS